MNQLRVVKSLNNGVGVLQGQYASLYREIGSALCRAGPGAPLLGVAKYLGRLGWTPAGKEGRVFTKGEVNVNVWDGSRSATKGTTAIGSNGANIVLALSPFSTSLSFFTQLAKTSGGTPTVVVTPMSLPSVSLRLHAPGKDFPSIIGNDPDVSNNRKLIELIETIYTETNTDNDLPFVTAEDIDVIFVRGTKNVFIQFDRHMGSRMGETREVNDGIQIMINPNTFDWQNTVAHELRHAAGMEICFPTSGMGAHKETIRRANEVGYHYAKDKGVQLVDDDGSAVDEPYKYIRRKR